MADKKIDNGVFISKMPSSAQYKLRPNEYERRYDMTIIMKNLPEGVGCHLCGSPIGKCGSDIDDCYYCEEDGIFMHKSCLISAHRITRNPSVCVAVNKQTHGYHEDKLVNVKFIAEDKI